MSDVTFITQESNHLEAEYKGVRFSGTYYGFMKPPTWYFSVDGEIPNTGAGLGFEEKKAKGRGLSEYDRLFTKPAENGVVRMKRYIDERMSDGDE